MWQCPGRYARKTEHATGVETDRATGWRCTDARTMVDEGRERGERERESDQYKQQGRQCAM